MDDRELRKEENPESKEEDRSITRDLLDRIYPPGTRIVSLLDLEP